MRNVGIVITIIILSLFCNYPVLAEGWSVEVRGLFHLEPVVIGYNDNATDNYDPLFDLYALKSDDTKLVMTLDRLYRKSIKKDVLKWSLNVSVPRGQYCGIDWEIYYGTPDNLIIVEVGNSTYIDMKAETPRLIHPLKPGWHEFIIYGDREATEYLKINATADTAIPTNVTNVTNQKPPNTAITSTLVTITPTVRETIHKNQIITSTSVTTNASSFPITEKPRDTQKKAPKKPNSTPIPLGSIGIIVSLVLIIIYSMMKK